MEYNSTEMKLIVAGIMLGLTFTCSALYLIKSRNTLPQQKVITILPTITPPQLEDIVGQRFIWGVAGTSISGDTAHLISSTHAGGVILMENQTSMNIASMTAQIRELPHTLPFIIAIDQEGGDVRRMTDDDNPGGLELGNMTDENFCSIITNTNTKLSNAGVNTNFGIMGDIGWTTGSYITKRTYGNTLESVLAKIPLSIRCSKPMITTIKHFPGHGRTSLNSHRTIPSIKTTYEAWKTSDAQPFLQSIQHGVDIVMFGHLRYESIASEPATLSPFFHTYLRENGFQGLTITDDLGMLDISALDPIQTMKQAFNAGNDLLLYTTSSVDSNDIYKEALLYATSSADIYDSFRKHYDHIQLFKQQRLTN